MHINSEKEDWVLARNMMRAVMGRLQILLSCSKELTLEEEILELSIKDKRERVYFLYKLKLEKLI